MFQVMCHCLLVEMIDHQPFTSRSRTFHFHHTISYVDGDYLPVSRLHLLQPEFQSLFARLIGSSLDLLLQLFGG